MEKKEEEVEEKGGGDGEEELKEEKAEKTDKNKNVKCRIKAGVPDGELLQTALTHTVETHTHL